MPRKPRVQFVPLTVAAVLYWLQTAEASDVKLVFDTYTQMNAIAALDAAQKLGQATGSTVTTAPTKRKGKPGPKPRTGPASVRKANGAHDEAPQPSIADA